MPDPFYHPPENRLDISLSISVDFARDFRGWPPENVAAFMEGVARVTAAMEHPEIALPKIRGLLPPPRERR